MTRESKNPRAQTLLFSTEELIDFQELPVMNSQAICLHKKLQEGKIVLMKAAGE